MCCGAGGGLRSAVKEVAMDFQEEVENVRKVGADALIVCCPFLPIAIRLQDKIEVNKVFADVIGRDRSLSL